MSDTLSDWACFGDPRWFQIAARWTPDTEPRERLPLEGGWSMAEWRITVGYQAVTARRYNGAVYDHMSWYLAPLLDWLLTHWAWLLHEEAYNWPEKQGAPAARAVFAALGRYIGASDDGGQAHYRNVQAWWTRHALRAADPSALYPDMCFRRLGDDIEISWAGRQPVHAPEGFVLTSPPGYALLGVAAVARPLWDFLTWAVQTAPATTAPDKRAIGQLRERLHTLQQLPRDVLALPYVGEPVHMLLQSARSRVGLPDTGVLVPDVPAVAALDAAVLMFGGLNPCISSEDAVRLVQFLSRHQSLDPNTAESPALTRLVEERSEDWALAPFEEGYDWAEEVREALGLAMAACDINMPSILRDLGIRVEELALDTDSVRGVAVAGPGFAPAILVNMGSAFNQTHEGRRFTLAHELCHILFDRTRAKRLSHVSGPWTSPRTEKRANAFAVMFLASRSATRATHGRYGLQATREAARELQLGHSAWIEHLYNLDLIDEAQREQLRLKPSL